MALTDDEQRYLAGLKNATVNTNYGQGKRFAPNTDPLYVGNMIKPKISPTPRQNTMQAMINDSGIRAKNIYKFMGRGGGTRAAKPTAPIRKKVYRDIRFPNQTFDSMEDLGQNLNYVGGQRRDYQLALPEMEPNEPAIQTNRSGSIYGRDLSALPSMNPNYEGTRQTFSFSDSDMQELEEKYKKLEEELAQKYRNIGDTI